MSGNGWLQIALFTLLVGLLVRPLGGYMTRIFRGQSTAPGRILGPIERGIYRFAGIDATAEQTWFDYALALIAFNAVGVVLLYALQRLQDCYCMGQAGRGRPATGLAKSDVTCAVFPTHSGGSFSISC